MKLQDIYCKHILVFNEKLVHANSLEHTINAKDGLAKYFGFLI